MGGKQSKQSKKSKFELEEEKIYKSLNGSDNMEYNGNIVRNILLEKGIKIFTNKERKNFIELNEETCRFITVITTQELFFNNSNINELYIDFLIACHYSYKKMAEYLLQNYAISTYIVHDTFLHCIEIENIDICKWLFSFKNVDYNQLKGWFRQSYYDVFKDCCINGKLISAKWMYEHGKIDFSNESIGLFLEEISDNGHKQMLSWLINEVKCTSNENLIKTFGQFNPVE